MASSRGADGRPIAPIASRREWRWVVGLLVVALPLLSAGDGGGPNELSAGLSYSEVPHPAFRLGVLAIDPELLSLRVLDARATGEKALTARGFADRFGAVAVVNGGFFDEHYRPLGLLVCDGVERNPLRRADWGVFFLVGKRPRVVHTRDYEPGAAVEQAIQAGPRLVVDGRPLALKPQTARRSMVGIDATGRVYLAVSIAGAPLLSDLAELLARGTDDGGLGLSYALNLDGGPSTQLFASLRDFTVDEPGGWAVPSAIGVFPREAAEAEGPADAR